jgi:hypothetical protein
MKRLALITAAILVICPLVVLTACEGEGIPQAIAPRPEPLPAPAPRPEPGFEEPSPSGAGDVTLPSERIIVRNGDVSLVVEDVVSARDEIEQLAVGLGGFVVNSNIFGEEEAMRGFISIRIPSEQFDEALTVLRALALRVTSESTSTQDITEEYIDLQSRLRNAEATESQYLGILDSAEEVDDILRIYDALSQIRFEIEQIKGRIQYIEQISAMSLISITLVPEVTLRPVVPPGWSASETFNAAARGLTTFGQGLGTAFIWIGIFSPIWGTVLGITYWRRRRKKKASLS